MRFFPIILGILLLLGGVFCLFNGDKVFEACSWLLGLVVFLSGVGWLAVYSEANKRRQNFRQFNGWALAGGILAIIIGLGIVLIDRIGQSWELFLAVFLGVWAFLFGIILILLAFKLKKIFYFNYYHGKSGFWLFILILGILSVLMGAYGGIHPELVKEVTGMVIGILMLIAGFYTLFISSILFWLRK
ncbi:MAG: DUF308 domain-containing protein [Clostridia bacterium]|nr:DUF308 domain-containing protein [Clostridia bacterium]